MSRRTLLPICLACLVLGLTSLFACTDTHVSDSFPYEDLTEEAYVENAYREMNATIRFLENTEKDDIHAAMKDLETQSSKDTAPETITAVGMINGFSEYYMEKQGVSQEDLDRMAASDLKAFQEANQAAMEATIPNALTVNERSLQGKEYIGTLTFKDGSTVSFELNGMIGVSSS